MIEIRATLKDCSHSTEGLTFQIGQRDDTGTWIAMRDTTPMFCFEADTKEEVVAKAEAAIVAYHELR